MDETYLAISDRNNPATAEGKRSSTAKILVAVAVEIHQPRGFGRIRLARLHDSSAASLEPFVRRAVEIGSIVRTDGSAAYRALTDLGFEHQSRVQLGAAVPAHVSLAGVNRVAALVKRWILGTHHGALQPEHLNAYLEEFVFRFNRRASSSRGMLFFRLLQQAVVSSPVTYKGVVGKAMPTKGKPPRGAAS